MFFLCVDCTVIGHFGPRDSKNNILHHCNIIGLLGKGRAIINDMFSCGLKRQSLCLLWESISTGMEIEIANLFMVLSDRRDVSNFFQLRSKRNMRRGLKTLCFTSNPLTETGKAFENSILRR